MKHNNYSSGELERPNNGLQLRLYIESGERSRIIYPDNIVVSYSYDKSGQIEQVIDGTGLKTNYTYDANGRLVSKSLPNNTQSTYNYDEVGQVLEIQHQGPGGTSGSSPMSTEQMEVSQHDTTTTSSG